MIRVGVLGSKGGRQALGRLLKSMEGIQLVAASANAEIAEREFSGRVRVVVIWAVDSGKGCLMTAQLRFLIPAIPIVLYSAKLEAGSILSSLAAGAGAYVAKSAPVAQLRHAFDEAVQGRLFLCPQANWKVLNHLRFIARRCLTEREEQVAIWLCSRPEKDIALKLNISVQTIHTHAKAVYRKLAVHSRHELISRLTGDGPQLSESQGGSPDASPSVYPNIRLSPTAQ